MTQQWSIRNHLHFPAHALLIGEKRLREQQAEGARMPEGMPVDEPLRVLIAAALTSRV